MLTVREALAQAVQELIHEGQHNARLDAQVLLGHVLGVERAALYAYPERVLTEQQQQQFFLFIGRRKQHEPVAYLLGHEEFYGLDFLVDKRVLIPRPETELLVEAALHAIGHKFVAGKMIPIVADIGTGSGAIPIALALAEQRLPYLYACDICSEALEVARLNCQRHHVESRIRLLQGDLVAAVPEPVDVLTANLPYVGTEEMESIPSDVHAYEPHLALFSGPYGLDILQRFCKEVQARDILKPEAVILLEIGYQQSDILTHLLYELFPRATVTITKDYAGWNRIVQVGI